MKPLKKLMIRPLLLIACMAFSLLGCVNDNLESPKPNGSKEVFFTVNVPGASKPATRALGNAEENEIETIEILLFHSGGAKAGQLAFTPVLANVIVTDGGDITKKTFSLRMPEGKFDVVIFANARSVISSSAALVIGSPKTTVLNSLTRAMPALGWVSNPLSLTKEHLIPMWGEKTAVTISDGVSLTGIYLHRMLARVDMMVTGTDAITSKFKMNDIRIYNTQSHGRLVPTQNAANNYWNPAFINSSMGNVVTGIAVKPSLSIVATKFHPISYVSSIAADGRGCIAEMYMFEANKALNDADQNAPCMIIRGSLDGSDAGWYRLDFAQGNTYLDILRNHKYIFSIVSVNGTGYPTPEDALKNRASNIVANVTLWNEYDMGGIVFDGIHFLAVNPQDIECSKDAQIGSKLTIKTDNQSATPIVKLSRDPQDANQTITWIKNHVLGAVVVNGNRNEYTLTYDVEANAGAPRVGYIHVTIGRLTNVVRVSQSDITSNMLVIENAMGMAIDVLEFVAADGADPGEQKYRVKWSPKAETLYISLAPVANPSGGVYEPLKWVHYNTESGAIDNNATTIYTSPIDNQTGYVEFTIKPAPITHGVDGVNLTTNPFYGRSGQINFRTTGSDVIMRKSVILQQMVMNAIAKPEALYLANGSDYTFNVKSNRPWRATLTDNGNGMITNSVGVVLGQGGYNLPNGTNVEFTTSNDFSLMTKIEGTGKVKVELMDNLGNWVAIKQTELLCTLGVPLPLSNSYLVAPNSPPILIPVKRANGYGVDKDGKEFRQADWALGDQITGNYTAELVWTDKAHSSTPPIKSLGDNGAVKMIATVRSGSGSGSGADGYIRVLPGSGEGNAIVSVSVGGNIVWSWHIWVVANYNPNPATDIWMDRNLGATTNSKSTSSPSTLGLYYQWGRKDPMPGASLPYNSIIETASCIYYLGDGTLKTDVPWSTTGTGTLINSISDPLQNYEDWAGSNGNDSWITNNNPSLGTGDKTIYDPCPDGWQVPVHKTQAWNISANTRHWGEEVSNIYTEWIKPGNKWEASYGITWPTKGGYYPAAGRRYTSRLYALGAGGFYWSAFSAPSSSFVVARSMSFISDSVQPSGGSSRCFGHSVRCVAE